MMELLLQKLENSHHEKGEAETDGLKAYLEAASSSGFTPLHTATRHGNHDVASQLLDAGANIMSR